MGLWKFLNRRSDEKAQIELDFLREKAEIKLQHERERRDLELSLKRKKQELDEKIIDYKIREQEERMKEDFEDLYQSDDDDEETDPSLKMFAPMIAQMLKTNSPQNVTPSVEVVTKADLSPPKADGVTFTDEEINDIYKSLPAIYKKVARSMTDQQIIEFIKEKYPAITQECLNRMILKVKQ
jgi:hypothetical protein